MPDEAEERVSKFYNLVGWETDGDVTEDAKRWEDLRRCAQEYITKCRLRVLRHIPEKGKNILDMASGPIQYKEYLAYSKNFKKRYCIDLSSKALEDARKKIGEHGVFICGSFLDIPLESDFFDCAISLHTIYHIDREKQEEAVRKLIRVTKPGHPVVIVYSNPFTLIGVLVLPIHFLRKIMKLLRKIINREVELTEDDLYFFPHPLKWWDRFRDVADLQIVPWRSFTSSYQKALIPNNNLGKKLFDILFKLEETFPELFVKYFQYPMIILRKKNEIR